MEHQMHRATHHASIDHGRVLCQHCAPAVALDVNEAQQLWVLDILAGNVPSIGGKVGREREAGDGVLGKLCGVAQCSGAGS